MDKEKVDKVSRLEAIGMKLFTLLCEFDFSFLFRLWDFGFPSFPCFFLDFLFSLLQISNANFEKHFLGLFILMSLSTRLAWFLLLLLVVFVVVLLICLVFRQIIFAFSLFAIGSHFL